VVLYPITGRGGRAHAEPSAIQPSHEIRPADSNLPNLWSAHAAFVRRAQPELREPRPLVVHMRLRGKRQQFRSAQHPDVCVAARCRALNTFGARGMYRFVLRIFEATTPDVLPYSSTGSSPAGRRRLRDALAAPALWMERAMSQLMFTCPKTRRRAPTGVDTDVKSLRLTWAKTLKVNCSLCGGVHEISVREAFVQAALHDATEGLRITGLP
jgi:hypothetical protein